MPHTSFPEIMGLEGNYLLTKQAETTVPDILLEYFNFPRNPEKIIPWDGVVNEGMTFQFPSLASSDQQKWVTAHLVLVRGALLGELFIWLWEPPCACGMMALGSSLSFWEPSQRSPAASGMRLSYDIVSLTRHWDSVSDCSDKKCVFLEWM